MQTLNLAVELSNMTIQEATNFKSPTALIQRAKDQLNNQAELLGRYIHCAQRNSRKINDMLMTEYQLEYEKQTLAFQLIYFQPRDTWEIRNFQILSK